MNGQRRTLGAPGDGEVGVTGHEVLNGRAERLRQPDRRHRSNAAVTLPRFDPGKARTRNPGNTCHVALLQPERPTQVRDASTEPIAGLTTSPWMLTAPRTIQEFGALIERLGDPEPFGNLGFRLGLALLQDNQIRYTPEAPDPLPHAASGAFSDDAYDDLKAIRHGRTRKRDGGL